MGHVLTEYKKVEHLLPPIERWQGILGDRCPPPELWKAGSGAWGCYKSHVNILEYCINNNVSSYIVFEDDFHISNNFEKVITQFLAELPEDWEQIYLGGDLMHRHISPPIKISNAVYRPYNVNRTHCFAVSRKGMKPIYQHISNLPFEHEEHIDHHLGRWHEIPTTKVYCPGEWIVGQHGFQSTVSGRIEDPTFYSNPRDLALNHYLYDYPICVVYKGPSWLLHKLNTRLHPGNNVDAHGYDVTLNLAGKMLDPLPEVQRWYNWVRSEVVNCNFQTPIYPCLYHNKIKEEHLKALGVVTFVIDATTNPTVKYVTERLQELPTYK